MRRAVFRLDRHSILGLVGRDLAVVIAVFAEINGSGIGNGDHFTICHGREGVVEAISSPVIRVFADADLHIIIEGDGVTRNNVLDVYIGHVSVSRNRDRISESSGGLIIGGCLGGESLARLLFLKDYISFYFVRELDLFLGSVKICLIIKAEADIGRRYQLGVIGIILIKLDREIPISVQVIGGIDLIRLPRVHNVDLQFSALFFRNRDAGGHCVSQYRVIIKLICGPFRKGKGNGVLLICLNRICTVRILGRTGNNSILQEVGQI